MVESTSSTRVTDARNSKPLLALLAANAVSLTGSMTTVVALPWFVLETTGSPARAGVTGFLIALPRVLAGVFGGALVDRLGFRRTSILADTISGCGIGLVPLLYHMVGLAFWQLLACVFAGALLDIPGITARRSLLPELGGLAGLRLERVTGAFETNQAVAQLAGPPLAGVLVAWLGASNVLWLDAASFGVSALAVALAVPSLSVGSKLAARDRYRDDLMAGLRFLRGDRLLLWLALSITPGNLLGAPFYGIMLPVYARDTYGTATSLGLMTAALGAGTLAGATLFGAVGHRLPRRTTLMAFFLIAPITMWSLLARPPLLVVMVIFAVSGVAAGPVNPLLMTVRLERIPADLRGRVFSTFSTIATGLQPVGMLLGAVLIATSGLRLSVLVLAAGSHLAGLLMLFVSAFREMEHPPATDAVTVQPPA